jgi:hypothetical protein
MYAYIMKKKDWQAACRDSFLSLPKTLRLLYVHAYLDRLWNLNVSQRVRLGGARSAVAGDIVLSDIASDIAVLQPPTLDEGLQPDVCVCAEAVRAEEGGQEGGGGVTLWGEVEVGEQGAGEEDEEEEVEGAEWKDRAGKVYISILIYLYCIRIHQYANMLIPLGACGDGRGGVGGEVWGVRCCCAPCGHRAAARGVGDACWEDA